VQRLDQDFIDALVDYRSRSTTAANRMQPIQNYCVSQLASRGLTGVEIEQQVRVAYKKHKAWDVVLVGADGRPELAITCRSIISNHGGTVPNRVDDLLGEGVSLHRAFPKAVVGYLLVMSARDERRDVGSPPPARDWFAQLVASATRVGGRSSAQDLPERFEAIACLQVDFDADPYILTDAIVYPADENNRNYGEFFDVLVGEHAERFL
jgi:hypothetical protein